MKEFELLNNDAKTIGKVKAYADDFIIESKYKEAEGLRRKVMEDGVLITGYDSNPDNFAADHVSKFSEKNITELGQALLRQGFILGDPIFEREAGK